jgi:hypothetical protein
VPSPEELDVACKKALPIAKRALVEGGISPEKVDAMSEYQVGLLYTMKLNHELMDAVVKGYSLPYPAAVRSIEAAQSLADRAKADGREIIPIASQVYPAFLATRGAVARGDRQVAVLRVIEAFRIYGASHGAKLPDRLSDIKEVPIPEDPITAKPFEYRRDGDKAFLSGPTMHEVPLNYEITMAAAK